MHAKIGMNAGQNQAGEKGCQQEWQNFHGSPYCLLRSLILSTQTLWSAEQYRSQTARNNLSPVFRLQRRANTQPLERQFRERWIVAFSGRNRVPPARSCNSPA